MITPLLELDNLHKKYALNARIFAKTESCNPCGSIKDRAVKFMLDDAFARGRIRAGATVIEPTSGNTGIALASLGAARGLKVILTMPENMSEERRKILRFLGAELALTPAEKGILGAAEKAEELRRGIAGSVILGQFENPANKLAHYKTTAPEIWVQSRGRVDIFVAGVGTGGTLAGCAEYLRTRNPNVEIYAVEPVSSPVLSGGKSGVHALQGIGAGFVPELLDISVLTGVIAVTDEQAFEFMREVARTEGVFAGISSGAALCSAVALAAAPRNAGKNIVTVLPDGGFKYLSAI